jgi:monoamine oxidase
MVLGRDWWLEGGFSQVVDYLATSEMNILLSRQVSSIDYNDEKVVVTTTDGDIFKSKHVIVTVPLGNETFTMLNRRNDLIRVDPIGVLKNNKITFSPELPTNYQSAINSLNMGVVDKHVLQFSEVFWPTDAEFFYLINEGSSRLFECAYVVMILLRLKSDTIYSNLP